MTQQANLDRVKNSIATHVKTFVRLRWVSGQERFYMRELHDYIFAITQTAPASPDRVLRELRLYGHFDYKVVNRKESLYEITAFGSSTRSLDARTTTVTVTVNHLSPTGRLLETLTAVRKQDSNTTTFSNISKSLDIQPGDSLEIIGA
jgi:hypothetical protein